MAPPSAAQSTKSQVQQMRDWRMKYGQSVPQNTVRNMSTKDNLGTLPINLYALAQPASEPLEFFRHTPRQHAQHSSFHWGRCFSCLVRQLWADDDLPSTRKQEGVVKVNAKEIPGSQVETVCRR
ncbi:Hypothetical predicted protein [Paramuricea clavata]|uniref:Uncharacterized protein n=1 Tax=Paramuricea clavata TaxID=317549 RepID=A0A7D9LDK2_PARCT|nr:Hypothetical predicted protein [Paramuricea clavata]